MAKEENKIKNNIKNIAYFALYRSNKVGVFKDLQYDFYMTKEEIINTLDLFKKAKFFDYKIFPLESSEEENYDFGSVRARNEFNTGRFKLFSLEGNKNRGKFIQITLENIIKSPRALNDFIKKNNKYINLPVSSSEFERTIGKLKINLKTGDFVYFNKKDNLVPNGQEYKLLYTLITSPTHQSSYEELLKNIIPNISPDSKINRMFIHTLVKKINVKLGILPKKKKHNPEFIKNIKRFGYRILG
ncbi:hypothetical protein A3A95_00630 [Candidatus Nomurabacteria bacterium RIFCSPLOWO2_01_FULL_39_18]|uniref:OmpR/PhoB-type domain-containing protein n=1 Tax=Candidatus Nomurabacteria bacterium RIFCSPHIGHO2_01_FULL_40_24b TaxID=1801739 RepID=A0A1F6V8B4_9BACT|nr:MAG: hypothetical protein A2647_01550 [Candidatus Nomurabacteria bacterium RIFCSPHIGHO2_01_FULL_40_24b]OGI89797.1 MAG: hypothetical protein A3A95_00630 [Candidatus Nomurabacteria bacterium RIFCSPLOWO2_01_FULL_39_18]